MSAILFLMDFGGTTNIYVLPELRRIRFWAIHSFMSLRQASMFHSFTLVSGSADMWLIIICIAVLLNAMNTDAKR